MREAGKALHKPLAWLFILALGGQTGAALYHHYKLRDETMNKMLSKQD